MMISSDYLEVVATRKRSTMISDLLRGNVSFTFSPAQKVGVGKTVTATATGSEGTSEFSAPRTVVSS